MTEYIWKQIYSDENIQIFGIHCNCGYHLYIKVENVRGQKASFQWSLQIYIVH